MSGIARTRIGGLLGSFVDVSVVSSEKYDGGPVLGDPLGWTEDGKSVGELVGDPVGCLVPEDMEEGSRVGEALVGFRLGASVPKLFATVDSLVGGSVGGSPRISSPYGIVGLGDTVGF